MEAMIFQFVIFISTALSIWFGLHYYTYVSLIAAGWDKAWIAPVLWTLGLSFPLLRGVTLKSSHWTVRITYWLCTVWVGAVFLLCFWFGVSTLLRDILRGVGWVVARDPKPWFLVTSLMVLGMILFGMFRAWRGPWDAHFLIDKSARYGRNQSLRLVQISDVHLGLALGIDFLKNLVERINAMNPDLVFITGDLFDPEFPADEEAGRTLRSLVSRHGVFAVSGNHEFYAGIRRFQAMMDAAGIRILNNETALTTAGIQVAGIHDLTANRMHKHGVTSDMEKALRGVDAGLPSVLLAHQPKRLEAAAANKIDLVLSGHTHAGQIFPFIALVRIAFRYVSGRYRIGQDTDLIVNTGTGFWGPPLRIGTHSQIVVVDFRF